jgi:hypothetical protein
MRVYLLRRVLPLSKKYTLFLLPNPNLHKRSYATFPPEFPRAGKSPWTARKHHRMQKPRASRLPATEEAAGVRQAILGSAFRAAIEN